MPENENSNSLELLIRKVQDRIVLSTLRRSLVKAASKPRFSIEYEDRDEMIVAHMVDGVDAFIKEMVNSLDVQLCRDISTFIDKIEEIFKQRMRIEIRSNQ
ncbi:hypothetical protein Tco_1311296 [Tanacetum coccineum]